MFNFDPKKKKQFSFVPLTDDVCLTIESNIVLNCKRKKRN